MAGKVAAEKFFYSVDAYVTVEVAKTRDMVELGCVDTMHFWSWKILVEGRERFKGANLVTMHDIPDVAALTVLQKHTPSDGLVPFWFQGTPNGSQKNFFKNSGQRMGHLLKDMYSILDYPGAQAIIDGVLTPMESSVKVAYTVTEGGERVNLGPVVSADDVVIGEVSEDTRRAAELRDTRSEGSGNVAAATRPLVTSPFSN